MDKTLKKSFFTSKNITGIALFVALTIILQFIGNFISFGPVNINLSLIPIAIGALLFGPIGGAILGFFNGAVVLFSTSTIALFYPLSIAGTIIACLLKTTLAGLVAGFIFLPFKNKGKKEILGAFLASISVPIINTGIFSICFMLFFRQMAIDAGNPDPFNFLLVAIIGVNFVFEFLVNVLLSSAIYTVYHLVSSRKKNESL